MKAIIRLVCFLLICLGCDVVAAQKKPSSAKKNQQMINQMSADRKLVKPEKGAKKIDSAGSHSPDDKGSGTITQPASSGAKPEDGRSQTQPSLQKKEGER